MGSNLRPIEPMCRSQRLFLGGQRRLELALEVGEREGAAAVDAEGEDSLILAAMGDLPPDRRRAPVR